MKSPKRRNWFITVSLALLLLGGCTPDDEPDPTSDAGLQDVEEQSMEDAEKMPLA